MFASRFLSAALFSAVAFSSAAAQNSGATERIPSEFERRSSGSIAFVQSRPLEGLRQNIGFGYGANGAYQFRLDRAGVLSLRGDIGFLGYGQESFRVPLSSTIGGRIQVDVRTTNYLLPLSIGPQLQWPKGKIRPYANAGIGAQYFFTESTVDGVDDSDGDNIASTKNYSDWTSTWVAGGGVYFPVYEKTTSVMIDLGVQYIAGGRARYLRPGSIQDLPNAQIAITPLESDTHLMLVRLGVRIGM
jgi:opacity protein-like surface antigen